MNAQRKRGEPRHILRIDAQEENLGPCLRGRNHAPENPWVEGFHCSREM